jgi:hypothetical protein
MQNNPYAPPSQSDSFARNSVGRVWRTGAILNFEQGTQLPHRCVMCNKPAQVTLERKLYWHSPWWALTILAGLLTYAIVAIVVRKRADVRVGLCDEHASKRRKMLGIAWASALVGIGGCAASLPTEAAGFGFLLGLVGVLVALGMGQKQASVLRPVRIDTEVVRLRGAGEPFLGSLEREAA